MACLPSCRIATSSEAALAFSVVKYVNAVPLRPARCTTDQPGSKDRGKETHPGTTDAMDIVFAVIWEVVVLPMPISLNTTQPKRCTYDDISDILDVYSDEARTAIAVRQDAIDNRTHGLNRTAKEKTSTKPLKQNQNNGGSENFDTQ